VFLGMWVHKSQVLKAMCANKISFGAWARLEEGC